jgi:AraC-like DNA-binding protein
MVFQFNSYSALLLLPFTQGLLFSILLIGKTEDKYHRGNLLLSGILLLLTIRIAFWMLGFAGLYDSHDAYTSFMFYFPFSTICLIGPLLYLYFLAVTNQNFKFRKEHVHHLWLPITWLLLVLGKFVADFMFYYPFPQTAAFQYGTRGPLAELDKTVPFVLITYGSFLYYLWLTLKSYYVYRRYTDQNLSSLTNVDFAWLKYVIMAIGGGIIVMLMYQLINWVYPLSYKADWYSYLFLGVLVYYLSIKGYQVQLATKPDLYFTPHVVEINNSETIQPTAIPDLKVWVQQLTQLLEKERPYLVPDLTLSQLSKLAKINTGLLSKVINTGFNLNFNDFVNSYRVKEVIAKLEVKQHRTFTLLGIALESGFNSKATFNRAFKKHTGKTPVEYLNALDVARREALNRPVTD